MLMHQLLASMPQDIIAIQSFSAVLVTKPLPIKSTTTRVNPRKILLYSTL